MRGTTFSCPSDLGPLFTDSIWSLGPSTLVSSPDQGPWFCTNDSYLLSQTIDGLLYLAPRTPFLLPAPLPTKGPCTLPRPRSVSSISASRCSISTTSLASLFAFLALPSCPELGTMCQLPMTRVSVGCSGSVLLSAHPLLRTNQNLFAPKPLD